MADDYEKRECPRNLYTGFDLQNSPFLKWYKKLEPFMGHNNAHFLLAVTDYYKYLRSKGKVKDGELFFCYEEFEEKYGISMYNSKKALKEISWLVQLIGCTVYHSHPIVRINEMACFVFGVIVGNQNVKDKFLRNLFESIQKDRELRKKMLIKIRKLKVKWQDKGVLTVKYMDISITEKGREDIERFYMWLLGQCGLIA